MSKDIAFYTELGDFLAEHCANTVKVHQVMPDMVDQAAQDVADFLQATRKNADLSLSYLATLSEVPESEIFALEHGLIRSTEIKSQTLHALAAVLDVDIDVFALLLEREIPQLGIAGAPAQARNQLKYASYLGKKRLVLLMGVVVAAILASLSLIALLGHAANNDFVISSTITDQEFASPPIYLLETNDLLPLLTDTLTLSLFFLALLLFVWLAIRDGFWGFDKLIKGERTYRLALSSSLGTIMISLLIALVGRSALAQTTTNSAFTYQGYLELDFSPVNTTCDFNFRLYSTEIGDNQIGSEVVRPDVDVYGGVFSVKLDFGDTVFASVQPWLETDVSCFQGNGSFETLNRVKLTNIPRANGVHWDRLLDAPSDFADRIDNNTISGSGSGLNISGSGSHYTLSARFAGSGNATAVAHYTLFSTVGQSEMGVASSDSYQLQRGFWHSAGDKVLVLYALALDNLAISNGNLARYYYDVVDALLNATHDDSSKIAVLLVDWNGSAEDHILVIANGQRQLLGDLPDENSNCETLTANKNEIDITIGEELGCFIQWARGNFRASKTLFSFVGHGVALAPAVDDFYCIVNRLPIPCSEPDDKASVTNGAGFPIVPTYKAVNPDWTDHHPAEGIVDPCLITPHALAVALQKGTDNGANPLDVVDVTHCFAASIEEFYELSHNPDDEQKPYARTFIGSPNYTYFAPELLAATLSEPELEQEATAMAEAIIAEYEAVLQEADKSDEGDPDIDHPRIMVAVESSEIPPIKEAMDDLATELLTNNKFDETKIMAAYTSSIKYDTMFCQGDWELAAPDALSDIGSFTQALAMQYGAGSSVAVVADLVRQQIETAVITHTLNNGKLWFADIEPLSDWDFGDPSQTPGISGYSDFQGITKTGEITTHTSFQSLWYTSTTHPDPRHSQIPYGFVVWQNKTWADVFYKLWAGKTLQAELCLPEFPSLQRVAELSVEPIIFLLDESAMVSVRAPTQLSPAIHTENIVLNPLVEFIVTKNDDTVVFTNTISAGYLVTGIHQINASEFWISDPSSFNQTYNIKVTVYPSGERFIDLDPSDNVDTFSYQNPIVYEYAHPSPILANHSGQWIVEDEISLPIEQALGDSINDITIATYMYDTGPANTQIAPWMYEKDEPEFTPDQITFSLSEPSLNNLNGYGAVELHIWGFDGGNLSFVVPSIVQFNYVRISRHKENYFRESEEGQDVLMGGSSQDKLHGSLAATLIQIGKIRHDFVAPQPKWAWSQVFIYTISQSVLTILLFTIIGTVILHKGRLVFALKKRYRKSYRQTG